MGLNDLYEDESLKWSTDQKYTTGLDPSMFHDAELRAEFLAEVEEIVEKFEGEYSVDEEGEISSLNIEVPEEYEEEVAILVSDAYERYTEKLLARFLQSVVDSEAEDS